MSDILRWIFISPELKLEYSDIWESDRIFWVEAVDDSLLQCLNVCGDQTRRRYGAGKNVFDEGNHPTSTTDYKLSKYESHKCTTLVVDDF